MTWSAQVGRPGVQSSGSRPLTGRMASVPVYAYPKVHVPMTARPARCRVRHLSAAAAVLAVAATLTACSDDGDSAPTSRRQLRINADLKSAAKNLATLEEVFYVDHRAYTDDGAALAKSGQPEVARGAVLAVSVDDAGERYCIRAWSRAGEVNTAEEGFTYASDGGGLSDPGQVAGWCAKTATDDFVKVIGS